jgi:hypothetical protein
MKILYCHKCGEPKTRAYGDVTIVASLSHTFRGTWLHYGQSSSEVQGLDNVNLVRCDDCDEVLHTREVEKCPHLWRVGLSNKAERQCEICGEMQRGSVVWTG